MILKKHLEDVQFHESQKRNVLWRCTSLLHILTSLQLTCYVCMHPFFPYILHFCHLSYGAMFRTSRQCLLRLHTAQLTLNFHLVQISKSVLACCPPPTSNLTHMPPAVVSQFWFLRVGIFHCGTRDKEFEFQSLFYFPVMSDILLICLHKFYICNVHAFSLPTHPCTYTYLNYCRIFHFWFSACHNFTECPSCI